MKIYLVTGTSGSYSDRSDWAVKAFTSKSKADAYAAALPGLLAELCKITDADIVEANREAEEINKDYKARFPESTASGFHWNSDPKGVAQRRAYDTMRELHDPCFSPCGDVMWEVSDLELVD